MIGIAGIARAGKDTLANCLKEIVEREFECDVEIIHLADKLKSDLDKVIACNFYFQVHTDNTEQKNLIRPILVAYGEAMKKKWGKEVWIKKLHEEIKARKEKKFYIIADVRFDFEVDYLFDNFKSETIHIRKTGNEAPNETEKLNDPLVRDKCDIKHQWPPYEPHEKEECKGHAEILWQMIPQEKKDIWLKTLN